MRLAWRGSRELRQVFVQNPEHPTLLTAADPGYLHQRDDWYILDADPSKYMLVYYTGER
jgi:VDE lipocalin domain